MKGPRGHNYQRNTSRRDPYADLRAAMRSSGFVELDEHGNDSRGISRGPIPLINAAERNLPKVVAALLDRGDTVSLTDATGYTALHAAAYHGHSAVATMLAAAGSDLDAATLEGDTPLHLATGTGKTEAVVALIEAGASVDSRNPGGATPLYVAAMEGRLGPATALLRAKANPLLAYSNSTGKTFVPLDVAVQTGRSAVVALLLRELGIGGCGGPSGGLDALRQAVVYGKVDMIAVLMDAGVTDSAGMALINAIESGQEASVEYLLRQQKERQASFLACYVNIARNDMGATALICSCSPPNVDLGPNVGVKLCSPRITRRLIDAGADTSSAVRIRFKSMRTYIPMTPLKFLKISVPREDSGEEPYPDELLHRLEAIRRLLLQAGAVHAVSWLWPDDVQLLAHPGKSTGTVEHSSTPLTKMLPALRRRARRRSVLWETLFRYSKDP